MARYDVDDIVTYWFVIVKNEYGKQIKGYSDNKELVKFYLEFHKCKNYEITKKTGTIGDIYKILEENVHDEIVLCNITIRNPKNKNEVKIIQIPATETEMNFIREESEDYLLSVIPYSYLDSAIPYMKRKYQQVLQSILLNDVINKVIYNNSSRLLQNIGFDQLKIMIRLFPDNFK